MTQVIRLKQIENGAGIANAIALAHPPANITANVAPRTWNTATQSGNIPPVPTFTVAGNTLTLNPNDGSPATVFNVTLAADVFLTQVGSQYNSGTGNLELVLTNGSTITIPMSDLVPVAVGNTAAITLAGTGTTGTPITATLVLDPSGTNMSAVTAAGLLTTLTTANSTSVNLSGAGTSGSPLVATAIVSPAGGNALTSTPTGLLVTLPAEAACLHSHFSAQVSGLAAGTTTFVALAALTASAGLATDPFGDGHEIDLLVNGVHYSYKDGDYSYVSNLATTGGVAINWTGPFALEPSDEIEVQIAIKGCTYSSTNT